MAEDKDPIIEHVKATGHEMRVICLQCTFEVGPNGKVERASKPYQTNYVDNSTTEVKE